MKECLCCLIVSPKCVNVLFLNVDCAKFLRYEDICLRLLFKLLSFLNVEIASVFRFCEMNVEKGIRAL